WGRTALQRWLAARDGVAGMLWSAARVVLTFNAVCFAWIFFRLTAIPDIAACIRKLYDFDTARWLGGGAADAQLWTLLIGYAAGTLVAVTITRARPLPEAMQRF